MAQTFLNPDRLDDRQWRPGNPFHRKPVGGAAVVDAAAVRAALRDYRRVPVHHRPEAREGAGGVGTVAADRRARHRRPAKLSLFEGLHLEYVNVYVDNSGADDSLLFSANQFFVDYDARALATGRLRLTQIVAIDPTVQLIENLDTGKWNYQRMRRQAPPAKGAAKPGPMPALPQVILRNAQIEYAETVSGQAVSAGTMVIEGQLAPSSDGQRYTFELQSRGGSGTGSAAATTQAINVIGPTVQGTLRRDTGEVTASLRDFKFGQDVRSMLPAQVAPGGIATTSPARSTCRCWRTRRRATTAREKPAKRSSASRPSSARSTSPSGPRNG
jgi:hypothetical protein